MDVGRLVKWILVIAALVFVARVVVPWVKEQTGGRGGSSVSAKGSDDSCVKEAERASETWGSGLGRFVNPPYDMTEWSNFRSRVDSQIAAAESECSCARESCEMTRGAMRDLRSLVSDLDTAIRSGSSPGGDVVQRQEQIDLRISEAGNLARAGK